MFYLLARHESDNHKQTKGGKEFSFSISFYPKGYFASDIINCIIKTLSKELYCTSERKYAQLLLIYLSFFRHQFSYKKEVWRWKRMTICFFVLFFVANICQSCSAFEGKPKYFYTSFKSFIGAVTRNTSNVVNLERFVFPNFPEKHYPKKSKGNAMTTDEVNSQQETAKKIVRF